MGANTKAEHAVCDSAVSCFPRDIRDLRASERSSFANTARVEGDLFQLLVCTCGQ